MKLLHFEGSGPTVIFFSRGRGKGHVIPDLAIVKGLRQDLPTVEVIWVSYSTGAAILKRHGEKVIDLGYDDNNPYLETLLDATEILTSLKPTLTISHEEFAVPVAARIFDVPNIFIIDFFAPPDHFWMQSIKYASDILFTDIEGIFHEPNYLRGKVFYSGLFSRNIGTTALSRNDARSVLNIKEDAKLILAYSGNWSEEEAPIAELLIPAFKMLDSSRNKLHWVAGRDATYLKQEYGHDDNINITEIDDDFELRTLACDLAITKATRKVSLELYGLGVPSISISHRLNRNDDLRVKNIGSNTFLFADSTDITGLANEMDRVLRNKRRAPPPPFMGLKYCIEYIAERLRSLV